MAIIQVRDTWDSFLHSKGDDAWSFYHPEVEVLFVPTCMGAHGLEAYKKWHARYMEACVKAGLYKPRRVLKTHFAMDSVIEETIVDIHFISEQESKLAWLVPGVKFLNPDDATKISVIFITVYNFSQHPFQIRTKSVYWDQGSVLKQLNLIQTTLNSPPQFLFQPEYVLPLLKSDPDLILQPDTVLNEFATRYEPMHIPSAKGACHESFHSTGTSDGSLLSEDMKPFVAAPARTHVRVNYAAAAADKTSKIFEAETLPVHAFSGISVHPKKFEQQASVVGGSPTLSARPATAPHPRTSQGSPKLSLFDPATGDAPIPKMRDPMHHGTQIAIGDASSEASPDPTKEFHAPRRDQRSSFEMTYSEDLPPAPSPGSEKTRLKPKPEQIQSHFQTTLSPTSAEEAESPESNVASKKKGVPRHLVSSISSTGVGMSDPPPVRRLIARANPNEQTHIEQGEIEPKRVSPVSPKHLAESEDPPPPVRAMRTDMRTTFDGPEKLSKKYYKKDMDSHIFDQPSSCVETSTVNSEKSKSSIFPSTTEEESAAGDYKTVPKKSNNYLQSVVFSEAFNLVQLPKRPVAEERYKAGQIVFGDDGGTKGLPVESPKWVISSGRSTPKRVPSGGRTTIQLG